MKPTVRVILHTTELQAALDHWYAIRHTWSPDDYALCQLIHRTVLYETGGVVEFPR